MKKTVFMIMVVALLASCGGGGKTEEKPKVVDITEDPVYQKGVEIVAASDCKTCHMIDEKNVGPAWRDVANKYADSANAVAYLSHKIINGGSGVWGQVPMAAHPTMPQEDAEALAKYVLLLKNK
jgi:cytochrome c